MFLNILISMKEILRQPDREPLQEFQLFVDLDNTTKEGASVRWTDKKRKLRPQTVAGFATLHAAGIPVGVATEQTRTEAEPFLRDIAHLTGAGDYTNIFNGIIIAEGGSVIKYANSLEWEINPNVPESALQEREQIFEWVKAHINEIDAEGWGILEGTTSDTATRVMLPSAEDQGLVTFSLWEQGPLITQQPEYIARYGQIEQRIQSALRDLNCQALMTFEAGNGTLRVVPQGINKAAAMIYLQDAGLVNMQNIGYVADGPNDIDLARAIVGPRGARKGHMIAVQNAVSELHELATYSAIQPEGRGFGEFVQYIFPDEYDRQLTSLREKGFWIAE